MAAGVHPTARARRCGDDRHVLALRPHRRRVAGLLRTPTAALQVHVGLPDEEALMLAYRGLRQRLPLLRALAAGSPYWHGLDSGPATSRSAIMRSYPRTTVPPLLRSWDDYVDPHRGADGRGRGPGPHLRLVGHAAAAAAGHPGGAGDGRRAVPVARRRADRPGAGHRPPRRRVAGPASTSTTTCWPSTTSGRPGTASTRAWSTWTGRCGPCARSPAGCLGEARERARADGLDAPLDARRGSCSRASPSPTGNAAWSRPGACRRCSRTS